MSEDEKLKQLKVLSGETDEDVLRTFLALAEAKVLQRAYPFDPTQTAVPDRYAPNQVEIANFMLSKRGAEGETYHAENGIYRTYSGGDVPPELLRAIIPMVGVM